MVLRIQSICWYGSLVHQVRGLYVTWSTSLIASSNTVWPFLMSSFCRFLPCSLRPSLNFPFFSLHLVPTTCLVLACHYHTAEPIMFTMPL